MPVSRNARNVVIVIVIAVLVAVVPSGQTTTGFVIQAVSLGFLAAIAWIASRLYREHRVALHSLGTRLRTILYGAVGVATLTLSAYSRLTASGPGTVAFVLLLAACAFAVFQVYRGSRTY